VSDDDPALGRPIGWWLKEADERIELAFAEALAGLGVDRRSWQVLDTVARRPTTRPELATLLSAFDPPDVIAGVVDDLASRGWVEEPDGTLRLTGAGEGVHAELRQRVAQVRQRVTDALPADDYATLVRLLRRLTEAF